MDHLIRRVPTLLVAMALFAFTYLASLLIVVRLVLSVTGEEIADGATADFAAVLFDVMGMAVALLVAWRTGRRLLARPPAPALVMVSPALVMSLSLAWLLVALSFSSANSGWQLLQGVASTAIGALIGAQCATRRVAAYSTAGPYTTMSGAPTAQERVRQ